MGMYTGLRAKIIVKEEFREMVDEINNGGDWSDYVDQFPFLINYSKQDRAEFIPRGSLAYMPDEWENVPIDSNGKKDWRSATATDGFERNIDVETGYWTFQCSLKNYNDEIQQFFEEILPFIAEEVIHLEYYYEEWARSTFYELSEGKIVASDKEGILYGYEEDENYWGY
jgi:hypothetical protein